MILISNAIRLCFFLILAIDVLDIILGLRVRVQCLCKCLYKLNAAQLSSLCCKLGVLNTTPEPSLSSTYSGRHYDTEVVLYYHICL